jgi:hypothetical protein
MLRFSKSYLSLFTLKKQWQQIIQGTCTKMVVIGCLTQFLNI